MPLLSNKLYVLNKIKTNDSEDDSIYRHNLTKEMCTSLDELNRKIFLYNQKIWTCRITGQSNLTFKEALNSEQTCNEMLKTSFKNCFEATILQRVHHSKDNLEVLVHKCLTQIHHEYCIDEPVNVKLKTPSEITLKGIVVKVDRQQESECNDDRKTCSVNPTSVESSVSDKENKTKKILSIKKDYLYNIKFIQVEKLVKDVPAEIIERILRPPSKEQIRMFITAHAVSLSIDQSIDYWIVSDEMVIKHRLVNDAKDTYNEDYRKLSEISRATEIEVYNTMKKSWGGFKEKVKEEICVDLTKSDDDEENNDVEPVSVQKIINRNIESGQQKIVIRPFSSVGPTKLIPTIAYRLEKFMKDDPNNARIRPMIFKCCQLYSVQQINKFPEIVRTAVLERKAKFEEQRKIEMMSAEERETFFAMKRNQLKMQLLERRRDEHIKIEDSELMENQKSIPIGTSVIIEEGLNEDHWPRLLALSEFIRSYRRLLFGSDDEQPNISGVLNAGTLTMKELCKIVIGNGDGNRRIFAELVSAMLKILVKDNRLKKRREFGVSLSDVPVTACNSAELLRLMLEIDHGNGTGGVGKKELKNNEENDFDNDEDDDEIVVSNDDRDVERNITETSPGHDKTIGSISEKLKSHDFHELSTDDRIAVLELLQNQILELDLINEFIDDFQRDVCEAYRKKTIELKELSDKLKSIRQVRLEMCRVALPTCVSKEETVIVVDSPVENEKEEQEKQKGTSETGEEKTRRQMLELKAKEAEENERRLEKQRQYASLDKDELECRRQLQKCQRDYENLMSDAKLLVRVQPLGTDRYFRRYWHFRTVPGAIYVESEIHDTSTKTATTISTATGLITETEMMTESIKTKWTMYITFEEITDLISSLHVKGVRESTLKQELETLLPKLKQEMKREQMMEQQDHDGHKEEQMEEEERASTKIETELMHVEKQQVIEEVSRSPKKTEEESLFLVREFKNELHESELSIRAGSLGGVEDYESLEAILNNQKISSSSSLEVLKQALATVFLGVHERFWNPGLRSESRRKEFLIATQQAHTLSRLNVLHSILDASVCWNKSADDDDNCRICRTNSHENQLLLCDSCNRAFHIFCLRPPLKTVPDGEWFCPKCSHLPTGTTTSLIATATVNNDSNVLNDAKEIDRNTIPIITTPINTATITSSVEKCSVCKSRDDEPLAKCVTCKRSFHAQCHEPVLKQIKRTGWQCRNCGRKRRQKEGKEENYTDNINNHSDEDSRDGEDEEEGKRQMKKKTNEKMKKKDSDNILSKRKSKSVAVDMVEEKKKTKQKKSIMKPNPLGKTKTKSAGKKATINRKKSDNKNKKSELESQENVSIDESSTYQEKRIKTDTIISVDKNGRTLRSGRKRIAGPMVTDSTVMKKKSRKSESLVAESTETDFIASVTLEQAKKASEDVLRCLLQHKTSWPFRYPMDTEEFPDYSQIVSHHIDLSMIAERCKNGHYGPDGTLFVKQFLGDIRQIFVNVQQYHQSAPNGALISELATTLEKFFLITFRKYDFGIDYSAVLSN